MLYNTETPNVPKEVFNKQSLIVSAAILAMGGMVTSIAVVVGNSQTDVEKSPTADAFINASAHTKEKSLDCRYISTASTTSDEECKKLAQVIADGSQKDVLTVNGSGEQFTVTPTVSTPQR